MDLVVDVEREIGKIAFTYQKIFDALGSTFAVAVTAQQPINSPMGGVHIFDRNSVPQRFPSFTTPTSEGLYLCVTQSNMVGQSPATAAFFHICNLNQDIDVVKERVCRILEALYQHVRLEMIDEFFSSDFIPTMVECMDLDFELSQVTFQRIML